MPNKYISWWLLISGFVFGAIERTSLALVDSQINLGEFGQLCLVGVCITLLLQLEPVRP